MRPKPDPYNRSRNEYSTDQCFGSGASRKFLGLQDPYLVIICMHPETLVPYQSNFWPRRGIFSWWSRRTTADRSLGLPEFACQHTGGYRNSQMGKPTGRKDMMDSNRTKGVRPGHRSSNENSTNPCSGSGSRNTGTVLTRAVFSSTKALLLSGPQALGADRSLGLPEFVCQHSGGSIAITNCQLVKPTVRNDRIDSRRTKGVLNLTISRAMKTILNSVPDPEL